MKKYIGIDILPAGKEIKDNITISILSKDENNFSCYFLYYTSYNYPDYDKQVLLIKELIRQFAADAIGISSYAQYQAQMLQKEFGQKIVSVYYSANVDDVKYDNSTWMMSINRDLNIIKVLKKIKYPFTKTSTFPSSEKDFHALLCAWSAYRYDALVSKQRDENLKRKYSTESGYSGETTIKTFAQQLKEKAEQAQKEESKNHILKTYKSTIKSTIDGMIKDFKDKATGYASQGHFWFQISKKDFNAGNISLPVANEETLKTIIDALKREGFVFRDNLENPEYYIMEWK